MREFKLSNQLEKRLAKAKKAQNGKILLGVWSFLLFFTLGYLYPVFYLIGGLIFLTFLLLSAPSSKEARVVRAGLAGEEILRNKLHQILSDDYVGFFSLPLVRGDIDCLLVGPTGVFLFNAKNHKGVIRQHNGCWEQEKRGRRGKVYKVEMKDPSRQIRREIAQIKEFLSYNSLKPIWIEGVIVFTHPEMELFSDAPGDPKVMKIGEVGTLFDRNGSVLKSRTIEKMENLIRARYRRGGNGG